jgi:hypothetical protein
MARRRSARSGHAGREDVEATELDARKHDLHELALLFGLG